MDLSVLWWWTSLYQNLTVGPLKNVNFNLLSFKRCPYDNDFWPISLRNLNVILGAWNGFSGNYRESCDRLFFLKKDFWIYGSWSRDWNAYLLSIWWIIIFKQSVLLIRVMKCIMEVNWLRKHLKKVRSSQPVILVLNWINFSLEYR